MHAYSTTCNSWFVFRSPWNLDVFQHIYIFSHGFFLPIFRIIHFPFRFWFWFRCFFFPPVDFSVHIYWIMQHVFLCSDSDWCKLIGAYRECNFYLHSCCGNTHHYQPFFRNKRISLLLKDLEFRNFTIR